MSLQSGFKEKFGVGKVYNLKKFLLVLNNNQGHGLNALAMLLEDMDLYKSSIIIQCTISIQGKVK